MNTTPDRRDRPPAVPGPQLVIIRSLIALRCETAGLSAEAASKKAGLSRAAVRQILDGRSSPSLGTLYALAGALGCSVCDLLEPPKKIPKKS